MKIIEVDKEQRELTAHGTVQFPLQVNRDDLSQFQNHYVRCHWHDDLEFSVVLQGSASYTLGGGCYELVEGQGIFINSGVPHTVSPKNASHVRMLAVIMSPSFICGAAGSREGCLMRPFLASDQLSSIVLDNSQIDMLRQIENLDARRPFAYELAVKGLLYSLFYSLVSARRQLCQTPRASAEDLRKLARLLDFLHTHYDEPLSLEALSAEISVSRESCCRFFKRMTGQTISQYLEEYRIAQSIPLLREGRFSVAQISAFVGFSNAGRFSSAFSKRMLCTPRQYLQTELSYLNQNEGLRKA